MGYGGKAELTWCRERWHEERENRRSMTDEVHAAAVDFIVRSRLRKLSRLKEGIESGCGTCLVAYDE